MASKLLASMLLVAVAFHVFSSAAPHFQELRRAFCGMSGKNMLLRTLDPLSS